MSYMYMKVINVSSTNYKNDLKIDDK